MSFSIHDHCSDFCQVYAYPAYTSAKCNECHTYYEIPPGSVSNPTIIKVNILSHKAWKKRSSWEKMWDDHIKHCERPNR